MFWPFADRATMTNFNDPRAYLRAQRLFWSMAETTYLASLTIQARTSQVALAMLSGALPPQAETLRMMSEKPTAAMESFHASWRAASRMDGNPQSMLEVVEAGLRPYRRKIRQNAKRLNGS